MTVTFIDNLAHMSDADRIKAAEWWAGLSPRDQEDRKEHATKVRANFGIYLPEDDADWPSGETWAEICYDDEFA